MLTRWTEKGVPRTYQLYPEFAAISLESHAAYVEHTLAWQQENHDLHQGKQKLTYDRAIRANAYNVGDPNAPQKGLPKLIKVWRGQHKVIFSLQYGRV